MSNTFYWQFDCTGTSNAQQISARIIVSSSPEAVANDLASADSILRENVSLISEENIETIASRDPFKVQLMLACFCAEITLMDTYEDWISDALPNPIQAQPPSRPPDDIFDCGIDSWILSAEIATNRLAKSLAMQTTVVPRL